MCLEKCKVVLFWDNASCHTETLQADLTNIKVVFLRKNTTSRLQSLEDRSSGILNINIGSCLFATSFAVSIKGKRLFK